MGNGFGHTVTIDGSDIAPIVLDGARIDYGRTSLLDQPQLPVCVIDILTRDAYPQALQYPEFGLGDWATDLSGFTDVYADEYAGVNSRITLGVPVVVRAGTASGFTDAYEDSYNGADMQRFSGSIQAIDYYPGTIRVTATPQTAESWSRINVGGTSASQTVPAEMEAARMIRLAAEAGVDLIVDGPPTVTVTAITKKTAARPLATWLTEIARDTQGVLFTDRSGWVHVQTKGFPRPGPETAVVLPPGATLLDPLYMKTELGGVRNSILVEYGPEDNNGDRASVTAIDQDSIDRYGLRNVQYSPMIQLQADAQDYAEWLNTQLAPWWTMPDAVVSIALLDGGQTFDILNIEQGDWVTLPQLLQGSPAPDYTASALGYTETLSFDDWQIAFHLSPMSGVGATNGEVT